MLADRASADHDRSPIIYRIYPPELDSRFPLCFPKIIHLLQPLPTFHASLRRAAAKMDIEKSRVTRAPLISALLPSSPSSRSHRAGETANLTIARPLSDSSARVAAFFRSVHESFNAYLFSARPLSRCFFVAERKRIVNREGRSVARWLAYNWLAAFSSRSRRFERNTTARVFPRPSRLPVKVDSERLSKRE